MILILGGDGTIGTALYAYFREQKVEVVATTRQKGTTEKLFFDLSHEPSTWQLPETIDVAIICAAMTNIRACEEDPANTKQVNVTNTLSLIDKLVKQGTFVIYLSSNHIFDGKTSLLPHDYPFSPLTTYGSQKAEVEQSLQKFNAQEQKNIAVLRLTKVVFPDFPLFANWKKNLREGQEIRAFSDYYFAPMLLDTVVEVIANMTDAKTPGTFQLSGEKDISYYEAALIGLGNEVLEKKLLKEGSILDIAGASKGPTFNSLCSKTTIEQLGIHLPTTQEVLQKSFNMEDS